MCEVKSSFKGGGDGTEGYQSEFMWLVIESVCGESWGQTWAVGAFRAPGAFEAILVAWARVGTFLQTCSS